MNSNISYVINAFDRAVILLNRESIDAVMAQSGVKTLRGFNNMAVAIVTQFGAEKGITLVPGEESEWVLGALAKSDVEYLHSFLKPDECCEIVDLTAARVA